MLHCAVPLAELPAAINGAVVGLATGPAGAAYRHVLNGGAEDTPLPCCGLGIVRGLDVAASLLYLLMPLPEEQLQHVTTLQVAALMLQQSSCAPGLHRVKVCSVGKARRSTPSLFS